MQWRKTAPAWLLRTWETTLRGDLRGCSSRTGFPDRTKLIRQTVGRAVTWGCGSGQGAWQGVQGLTCLGVTRKLLVQNWRSKALDFGVDHLRKMASFPCVSLELLEAMEGPRPYPDQGVPCARLNIYGEGFEFCKL